MTVIQVFQKQMDIKESKDKCINRWDDWENLSYVIWYIKAMHKKEFGDWQRKKK